MVAGPGFRSPVKQDYEPCKIPTFPPQIGNRVILARSSLIDNSGNIWVNLLMARFKERLKARELRRMGESIGAIKKKLGVSKSSVSLWCHDIELTKEQRELLTENDRRGGSKGRARASLIKKNERLGRMSKFAHLGNEAVGCLSKRDIFIAGIALYWAEGNKKNRRLVFSNSDPEMIKLLIKWLVDCLNISKDDIYCRVGINQIHRYRVVMVEQYWSEVTGIPLIEFRKVSLKKVNSAKIYENMDEHYGTLNLFVKRSTNLNYQILGFINAMSNY